MAFEVKLKIFLTVAALGLVACLKYFVVMDDIIQATEETSEAR